MSHWNYRLTVRTIGDEESWAVREVYYNNNGQVTHWSADPVGAHGESWQECADDLARMSSVMGLPVFDLDTKRWVNHKRRPYDGTQR